MSEFIIGLGVIALALLGLAVLVATIFAIRKLMGWFGKSESRRKLANKVSNLFEITFVVALVGAVLAAIALAAGAMYDHFRNQGDSLLSSSFQSGILTLLIFACIGLFCVIALAMDDG